MKEREKSKGERKRRQRKEHAYRGEEWRAVRSRTSSDLIEIAMR